SECAKIPLEDAHCSSIARPDMLRPVELIAKLAAGKRATFRKARDHGAQRRRRNRAKKFHERRKRLSLRIKSRHTGERSGAIGRRQPHRIVRKVGMRLLEIDGESRPAWNRRVKEVHRKVAADAAV